MTDNLEQDVARANRAEALLADELLSGAFDGLRSDYIKAWEATSARDTDARERLWQAVQIVGKVQSHLLTIMSNGTLAKHQISAMAKGYPEPRAVA